MMTSSTVSSQFNNLKQRVLPTKHLCHLLKHMNIFKSDIQEDGWTEDREVILPVYAGNTRVPFLVSLLWGFAVVYYKYQQELVHHKYRQELLTALSVKLNKISKQQTHNMSQRYTVPTYIKSYKHLNLHKLSTTDSEFNSSVHHP